MPNILIIDDYDLLRDVMKLALDDLGFVHTARSGEEGLALLDLICPEVVITDMNMPGMSGLDFIKAFTTKTRSPRRKQNELGLQVSELGKGGSPQSRGGHGEKQNELGLTSSELGEGGYENGGQPKIILYSALMTRELREQARALGVAACLEKPFDLTEMLETVERLLSSDCADCF
jgi:CheY-like chemotaxis protein